MATEAFGIVPGSPTLTNPDMILPGYGGDAWETPSPPINSTTLQRNLSLSGGKRRSVLEKPGLGPRLPVVAAGVRPTVLGSWQTESPTSDPNFGLNRRTSVRNTADTFAKRLSRTPSLRSSRSWQRTPSIERYDGTRSHSSLLGPGVPRPSLADRLNEEDEDGPDSPYTTTSESTNAGDDDDISTQAEEILANAKKRLTAMEGNLSRARSISITRSGSAASTSGDSGRLSRRISRSNLGTPHSWAVASSKLRQASLNGLGTGHVRVSSETAAPVPRAAPSPIEQRSFSALGHGAASGSPGLRTEWTDTSSSDSFSNGLPRHLEALPEDEMASGYDESVSRASPIVRQQLHNASSFYQSPASSTSTLSRARSSIALRDLQEGVADLSGKLSHLREATRRESLKRASLSRLKTPSPFTNAHEWADPRDRSSKTSVLSTDTAVRVSVTVDTPPVSSSEFSGAGKGVDGPVSASSASFKSPVSQFRSHHGLDIGDSPLLPIHPKIRHIPPTPTTPFKGHASHPSTDSSRTNTTTDSNADPISPSLSDAFPQPPDTAPTPPRSRSSSVARSRSGSTNQTPALPSHEDNPEAFDYSRFLLDSAMGAMKMGRDRSPSASSATTTSTTRPRGNSTARLSKASNTSGTSRASTIKRVSLSPSRRSRGSRGSSGSSGSTKSQQTIAQRRASGRSNSTASMQSITIPEGRRSASPGHNDAASPPSTASPTPQQNSVTRPGHARQLSNDSVSASSVASFATALERASSRLTIRSLSRSTLRNASAGGSSLNGTPMPTHRAGFEAYDAARNTSFITAVSDPDDSPPRVRDTIKPRANTINRASNIDAELAEAEAALLIPPTPTDETLPANVTKASAAILSAVLAVSHAAVREEDERRGSGGPARVIDPKDEEMLGRVLEGVIGAAVGLIGRNDESDDLQVHGQKANSWRESALPGSHEIEVDASAIEQTRQIWRMRCEVARRALSEEKPGEGF